MASQFALEILTSSFTGFGDFGALPKKPSLMKRSGLVSEMALQAY